MDLAGSNICTVVVFYLKREGMNITTQKFDIIQFIMQFKSNR